MAAVRADLDANVPVAREEMIRYCAPAQWFARTVRKPFTIHDTTIKPGQRVITLLASANRDEREYPEARRVHLEPAHRASAGLRPRPALLPRLPPGPAGDRDHDAGMAQAGAGLPDHRRRDAGRRRVSSGAGTRSRWRSDVWSYRLVAPYHVRADRDRRRDAGRPRRRPGAAAVPGRRHLRQRSAGVSRCPGPAAG